MPDIALCANETCPLRKLCYRHEAEPDAIAQNYDEFEIGVDGECSGFLKMPRRVFVRTRYRSPQDETPVFDRQSKRR